MASLASLTASEIISLTPDANLDTNEKEMQESVEEIDHVLLAAAARDDNRIRNESSNSISDNNGSASVPFCTAGSMHGATYSYALHNGEMHGSSGGGGGMIMYMDGMYTALYAFDCRHIHLLSTLLSSLGFRLSLKGGQPCLNLYFESWTLDTRIKFLLAMLFVLLLGIVTEFISKLRFQVSKQPSSSSLQAHAHSPITWFASTCGIYINVGNNDFFRRIIRFVLLGLGVGYSLFYSDEDWHVTTNPCCNYMQDEAKERNEEAKLEIQIQREEARNEQEEEEK